jgi:hypothetical protein
LNHRQAGLEIALADLLLAQVALPRDSIAGRFPGYHK